uniref:Uncharacterized protein n=1 Tax=Sinocyclocheilus anshuiensis TaxID=1608454 RepID=A0A671TAS1_9TELE
VHLLMQKEMYHKNEWGEEHEDGAVFGITLRREPVQQSADPTEAFVHSYLGCWLNLAN